MTYVYLDIEGDNLYPKVKTIFCIVTQVPNEAPKTWSDLYHPQVQLAGNLPELAQYLKDFEGVVCHNGFGYDYPVLSKFLGIDVNPLDTLILSRLCFPSNSILKLDATRYSKFLPKQLWGRHSLEAWGFRIGREKIDFNTFVELTPEMVEYCKEDVAITMKLHQLLMQEVHKQKIPSEVIDLEMAVADIIAQQMRNGVSFDVEAAEYLDQSLRVEMHTVEKELQQVFPPRIETMKTPAYYLTPDDTQHRTIKAALAAGWKRHQITTGPLRTRDHPFNPASRQQIVANLKERYGWKPKVFTDNDNPKIDEDVLEHLDYPEAPLLNRYLMLKKRLSQLTDGDGGLLSTVEDDGKIYGYVNTCGTRTFRMSHNAPNLAQVPGAHKPYGSEFRALFKPSEGRVMLGIDASGLEGRLKGHYLYPYDDGAFVDVILTGVDLHSQNAEILDVERSTAKTWYYAWLFGAGAKKLASITGRSVAKEQQYADLFLERWPALAALLFDLERTARTRGYLLGLDGRRLENETEHTALNTICQSGGAIVMKQALVDFHKQLCKNFNPSKWAFLLNVHDEWQLEVDPDEAEFIGNLGVDCIIDAGEQLNLHCPMDGEYKVGMSWSETH